jgi:hypothetical protein
MFLELTVFSFRRVKLLLEQVIQYTIEERRLLLHISFEEKRLVCIDFKAYKRTNRQCVNGKENYRSLDIDTYECYIPKKYITEYRSDSNTRG